MHYRRIIAQSRQRLGLYGRVEYLEGGDLTALVRRARGMVTVNSTAGIVALEQGCPVLTLSDPMYNLPGLTGQMSLDDFWRGAEPPDMAFFAQFRRCVLHATQIKGGFYCRRGIALAVENAARVLCAERSPLEELL
jgi:capsular polysaccharide export protein